MKKRVVLLATAFMLSVSSVVAFQVSSSAVQLRDGTVHFTSPPRLEGASTTQNSVYAWSATYYFTLDVPENAGEPLQRVTIAQEPSPDTVRFDLKDTEAFEGGRSGTKLQLGEVTSDRKSRSVTVNFNPPIPPGRRVTIALAPDRNPSVAGVYLFGVTAFPAGEKSRGQFLGFGRISIYSAGPDGLFLFRRHRIWR
jgi:hypothetical protein